jgi:hypothetical protein
MDKEFKKVYKKRPFRLFKDFGYKVIRLKYFIMIVVAMLLEIITLIIYIFNNEKIIDFDLITAGVLYGITSGIIIMLALSSLILLKTDKIRDRKRVEQFNSFRKNYYKLNNTYMGEINGIVKKFDGEIKNIEAKINYATEIADKYDEFIKVFSELDVPVFLADVFNYKMDNLNKEKLFFTQFSLLTAPEELEKINKESDDANEKFLREMDNIEKKLKIIV